MGEMSSIVSRSPPPSGSTSQENDFFWMSIRFGTSRTLSSRAKLRRGGGGGKGATTGAPPRWNEGGGGGGPGGGRPPASCRRSARVPSVVPSMPAPRRVLRDPRRRPSPRDASADKGQGRGGSDHRNRTPVQFA